MWQSILAKIRKNFGADIVITLKSTKKRLIGLFRSVTHLYQGCVARLNQTRG